MSKRTRKFLMLVTLFTMLMVTVFPMASYAEFKPNYETYSGFTTSEVPVLPPQEAHPKLWFDNANVVSVYGKRNADAYAASLWDSISKSPYLSLPLPALLTCSKSASEIHSYYGDMSRFAKYNAFMYVMEGNETYKARAIEALKRAYDGPIYGPFSVETCNIDPTVGSSPIDETYRANWAQNFAAAYDWMQPHLTSDDDGAIRARLADEAKVLHENLEKWGPRPHNHRSKPAWGLGSLALTLSDHPDAEDWLENALKMANTNTKYFFSADGVYREGSQYYIYSHINFVPFLYHYKNVSGVDNFRVFKPAFEWEFQTTNNKGWMPNIEDSYMRHNFLHMVAGQFMTENDATSLNPSAKLGNLFQWRYFNTDTTPWGGEFGNNTGASYDDTMDLDKYLTYDPTIVPMAPTGTATKFFTDGGQTIFRNHWNPNDPSGRYLLFHGMAEMDNHNQHDTLSFVIHAEDQWMASDSGYSRSAYGDQERKTWYRTVEAHNTVTIDSKWPVDFAENETPPSKDRLDTSFFDFEEKQARYIEISNTDRSENYLDFPDTSLGTISRSVAFPGQEYFVVSDRLQAEGGPRTFNLHLHGGRGLMLGEGNHRTWIYGKDAYGSSAKFAAWIFSDGAALTNKTGEVSYLKDDYKSYGYVTASKTAQNPNFMQVLIPLKLTEHDPIVTELSNGERVGGTVEKDGNLDTFVVQQGTAPVTLGRMSTDGTFGYVRNNGGVKQFSVQTGKSLSFDGVEWFQSNAPITLAMDVSNRDSYTGQVSTSLGNYDLKVKAPSGKQASSARVNGNPVAFTNDNGYVSLQGLNVQGSIDIDFSNAGTPDATAPAAIANLAGTAISAEAVRLAWTAPGNDGMTGTVASFDVRYSLEPITANNWNSAIQVANEPPTAPAGNDQSMNVRGLQRNTTYYFAMKAADEAGNISSLSNVIQVTTAQENDLTPPAAITDLSVSETTATTAKLKWMAPGNDGFTGRADSYEVRYSRNPITAGNWNQAAVASGAPNPDEAGTMQEMTVTDLLPGRSYFFAMKAKDESSNVSLLSNNAFTSLPEGVGPIAVQAVNASSDDGNRPENTLDGDLNTRWSALSEGAIGSRTGQWIQYDLGALYHIDFVKLAFVSGDRRTSFFDLEVSFNGVDWTKVAPNLVSSGMTLDLETYEMNQASGRYVRLMGFGNSASGWNSLAEAKIFGTPIDSSQIFLLHNPSVTDINGKTLNVLKAGSVVKVKAGASNTSDQAQDVALTSILYRPDGSIYQVSKVYKSIAAYQTEDWTAGFTLPANATGYYLKVFVADASGTELLSNPYQISKP
jgi:chitodextrinase